MANLVTTAEVEAIISIDSNVIADLTPFIDAAHLIVSEELDDSSLGLSDARKKEIERWLSAHFAAISDMRSAEEGVREAATQLFQHKVDLGLNVTMYGQQAQLLDTSGTLKRLNSEDGTTNVPSIEVMP